MRKFNVKVNGKSYEVEVDEVGGSSTVAPAPAPAASAPAKAEPAAAAPAKGEGTPIKAPMPGLILSLSHSDGDAVKENEKILVLEAMKMENDINATAAGKITYAVKKGDSVDTGAVLAYIK
ncbi:MAG: acetyl-CoA carboxylase biotin carboxyl carrier protein subunit [Clostridiales bacterium]|nr:acetyl-CoA carboxylase biotin carboxyl carrier protein subunit [Clostridiales bacterium]